MPKYFPIEAPEAFLCVNSNMSSLTWRGRALVADFAIPATNRVMRVEFGHLHIVRVLDEMPLSTENEPSPSEGLISNHFAYRVEGALFWESQSTAFYATAPNAKHYRFITGWTCLDVIADTPPSFIVLPS